MPDRYGELIRTVLFPAWEGGVRRRPTLSLLERLERSQWSSAEQLEVERLAALKRLLRHAYEHVPMYRARFEALGARPEDFRALADLARLPVLTREQASDPSRRAVAGELPTINKATGGTTGEPLRFAYDAGSEHWRQAIKLRGWGWAGYHVGKKTLYYWLKPVAKAALKTRIKTSVDRLLKREVYVDCTRRGEIDLDDVVAAIVREKPEVIVCFTQAGVDLARHINVNRLRAWDTIPVICCAERLWPGDRALLVEAFGERVYETYGCREVMLIAAECDQHDGLHVSAENVIVEIVVEEDGVERPARPGEVGEVRLTDLHNFGMPFIRYANGDLATAGTESQLGQCKCGRWMPRIASVEGRVAETMRDGRGQRVSGLLFTVLFAPHMDSVRRFQAVQHRDGAVTLKIVPGPAFGDDIRAAIRQRCADQLPGVEVRTELVGSIPLGKSGKRQVVLVEQ